MSIVGTQFISYWIFYNPVVTADFFCFSFRNDFQGVKRRKRNSNQHYLQASEKVPIHTNNNQNTSGKLLICWYPSIYYLSKFKSKRMNMYVIRLPPILLFIAWLLEQQDISDDSKIQYLERNDQGCNSPSRLHGTSTRIEGAAGINILDDVRVF